MPIHSIHSGRQIIETITTLTPNYNKKSFTANGFLFNLKFVNLNHIIACLN